MKLRYLYMFIIYNFVIMIANSETNPSPKVNLKETSISEINTKLANKAKEIKELEALKKSILEAKKTGKKLKIGVALSGGGSKGFAHIGVLRVLEENNIPIDYISGTSMGAIVSSLYAVGYSPDEIEVIVKTMDWKYRLSNDPNRIDIPLEEKTKREKYFASISYDDKLNFGLPKGLLTGQKSYLKLKELFWDVRDVKSFDEFKPKLRIVATDFNTGKAKTFDHGDLAHIVSASMAIPTIYDPVRIGDKVYIDGMISRNLPVEDLFEAGADIVIASDVGAPQVDTPTYNLLTVMTKISTYRGIESTEEQRKLANIVIDPDVKLNDASDFNDFDNLISKGEIAAREKLGELEKYKNKDKANENQSLRSDNRAANMKKLDEEIKENAKDKSEFKDSNNNNDKNNEDTEESKNIVSKLLIKKDQTKATKRQKKVELEDIYIDKLVINGSKHINNEYIENLLPKAIPNKFSYKEMEEVTMKIYAIPFVEKSYYRIEGSTLIVDVDENDLNHIRVGGNYNSDLGAKLALSTDLSKVGKVGRTTTLGVELGSYNSADFNNFWYYGERNKIGINLKLGYEQDPLFIYKGNELKAKSRETKNYADLSVTTRLFRQFDFSLGMKYLNNKGKFEVGEEKYKEILKDSEEYQEIYLNVVLDRRNQAIYPTRGSYLEIRNRNSGITDNVDYYSQVGEMNGYVPITGRLSFNGMISGGVISGGSIPIGNYFKLGGINNDLEDNYVSFYGYNMMRKLASKYIVGQLGVQYMLYTNLYLIGKTNILTYEGVKNQPLLDDGSNETLKDYKIGYGLTLGYRSLFGPLEVSLTNDADAKEAVILSVSIGYYF